jgi:uncharacterized protein YjbI with pentapeptide repeats
LVQTAAEAAGDNCESGGVMITSGQDANSDGKLADDEVVDTRYICNGIDGAAGSDGVDGKDGADGKQGADGADGADGKDGKDSTQLTATGALAVGDANCDAGGVKITIGNDADGDGKLQSKEVSSTRYVCNGAESKSSLVLTETLDVGDANCASGGTAIYRGLDANGDGVLDAAETEDTQYVCNGADAVLAQTCTVPARWDDVSSTCQATSDWSGAALAGMSLVSSYLEGVDFSGADLSGANLSHSDLAGADLTGANLTDAVLASAAMANANLTDAVLDGADFSGVDLSLATLDGVSGAGLAACPAAIPPGWLCLDLGASGNTLLAPGMDLSGLDLTGADLSTTVLSGVQATGLAGCPAQLPDGWSCLDLPNVGNTLVGPRADLSGLDLTGADFPVGTNLDNVDFSDTILTNASFADGVNLSRADFGDATLTGVDFGAGVDLSNASFDGADLSNATFGANVDLREADLGGAVLTGVDLTVTRLQRVVGNDLGTCPLALPAGWNCLDLPIEGLTLVGPGADLSDLNLVGVDLTGQDLSSANLDGADLTNATLVGADLTNVDLNNTTLTGITGTGLQSCPDQLPNNWDCVQNNLVGPTANLSGVDLTNANLQGAELTDANLTGATLDQAELQGVNLSGATLTGIHATGLDSCPGQGLLPQDWKCVKRALVGPGADVSGANLDSADLSGMDLTAADFTGADLTNADLSNADVTNANFTNAELKDATFDGATITGAVFTGANWDNTTCPDGSNSDDNGNTCL